MSWRFYPFSTIWFWQDSGYLHRSEKPLKPIGATSRWSWHTYLDPANESMVFRRLHDYQARIVKCLIPLDQSEDTTEQPTVSLVVDVDDRKNVFAVEFLFFDRLSTPGKPFRRVPHTDIHWLFIPVPAGDV
jgi:hypothetical protein